MIENDRLHRIAEAYQMGYSIELKSGEISEIAQALIDARREIIKLEMTVGGLSELLVKANEGKKDPNYFTEGGLS